MGFFGAVGPPMSDKLENARAFSIVFGVILWSNQNTQHVSIHTTLHQVSSIYCELKCATMDWNLIFATMSAKMMAKCNKYCGTLLTCTTFCILTLFLTRDTNWGILSGFLIMIWMMINLCLPKNYLVLLGRV